MIKSSVAKSNWYLLVNSKLCYASWWLSLQVWLKDSQEWDTWQGPRRERSFIGHQAVATEPLPLALARCGLSWTDSPSGVKITVTSAASVRRNKQWPVLFPVASTNTTHKRGPCCSVSRCKIVRGTVVLTHMSLKWLEKKIASKFLVTTKVEIAHLTQSYQTLFLHLMSFRYNSGAGTLV